MDAWRYGIYLLVFTFDISLEDKFHISARPCIILYVFPYAWKKPCKLIIGRFVSYFTHYYYYTVKHESKCNVCKMYPIVGFR